MADDRLPKPDGPMSAEEIARLQALTNKRNEALQTMTNTLNKVEESRRGIIDKMR